MPRPADPRKQQTWLRHFRRWQSSRLSVRDYCERLQLSEASFYSWKRTLQERGLLSDAAPAGTRSPRTNAPLFLPVAVAEDESSTGPINLILPDGWTVRVSGGFDARTLRQLLAVLRERPC